jgi:hypothetical protein
MKKKTQSKGAKKLVLNKKIESDFSQAAFRVTKEQGEKLNGGDNGKGCSLQQPTIIGN